MALRTGCTSSSSTFLERLTAEISIGVSFQVLNPPRSIPMDRPSQPVNGLGVSSSTKPGHAGEADDAIEERRVVRHVDDRSEEAGACRLLPGLGELRDEVVHDVAEGLSRGGGEGER